MSWAAAHLSWLVWILLAIWAPPLLYAIAIDVRLITAPGSGYPALTDPALVAGTLQVVVMVAALPGLAARSARSWRLLAVAWLLWVAHFAWTTIGRVRLDGARALRTPELWWPLTCMIAAVVVLLGVRRHFRQGGGGVAVSAERHVL